MRKPESLPNEQGTPDSGARDDTLNYTECRQRPRQRAKRETTPSLDTRSGAIPQAGGGGGGGDTAA